MHHVGAGMTLRRAVPPPRVDGRDHGVALDELAGLHVDAVRPQRLGDLLHVGDGGLGRTRCTGAGDALVGDLPAGLGVERGAIQTTSTRSGAGQPLVPCVTTGTRLPSTKMPRILASEINSSKPVNSVGPASTSSR